MLFMIGKAARGSTLTKRARTTLVLKVFVNYIQTTATLRLFTTRAPSSIKSLFGFSSVADGLSLDSLVLQCSVRISLWEQTTFYLTFPLLVAVLPPLVFYAAMWINRRRGKVR